MNEILAVRQAQELLENYNFREESGKIQKIERERLRKKHSQQIGEIGEKIISKAATVFQNIPEYKKAAVISTLPDFTNTRRRNASIGFELFDAQIDINFFSQTMPTSPRMLLLSFSQGSLKEQFYISTYVGTYKEDPLLRITAKWTKKGEPGSAFGAKAALKCLTTLMKIEKLARKN